MIFRLYSDQDGDSRTRILRKLESTRKLKDRCQLKLLTQIWMHSFRKETSAKTAARQISPTESTRCRSRSHTPRFEEVRVRPADCGPTPWRRTRPVISLPEDPGAETRPRSVRLDLRIGRQGRSRLPASVASHLHETLPACSSQTLTDNRKTPICKGIGRLCPGSFGSP